MARTALMNVMVAAVLKAGRGPCPRLRRGREPPGLAERPGDFVSAADHRADKTLIAELQKARPTYGFLTEESGTIEGSDKGNRWIIDPLDGTTNFLHGIPIFAISLGLEREGQLVAGVVYNPVMNELYVAERGSGAFLNDKRLRVAKRKELGDTVITTGNSVRASKDERYLGEFRRVMGGGRRRALGGLGGDRPRLGRLGPLRRLLAPRAVALGHLSAGILLVREAGGFVTDADNGDAIVHHRLDRRRQRDHPRQAAHAACRRLSPPPRFCRFSLLANHVKRSGGTKEDLKLCDFFGSARGNTIPTSWPRPRFYLWRMIIFLILAAFVALVLYRQAYTAFLSNPGLNAVIIAVLFIGIGLAFRQVLRLFPEIRWVNTFRIAEPGIEVERSPVLLAPMATLLGDRIGRMAISTQTMRSILDSIQMRLDEDREMSRYLVSPAHLPRPARHLLGPVADRFAGVRGDRQPRCLGLDRGHPRKPEDQPAGTSERHGHGLLGLALRPFRLAHLGFLDLQAGQAQATFYNDLEDWLSTVTDLDPEAIQGAAGGGDHGRGPARRHRAPVAHHRGGRRRRRPAGGRLEPARHHRHGQPCRGHPRPRPAYAYRAAGGAHLGRGAVRAAARGPEAAADHLQGAAGAGRGVS